LFQQNRPGQFYAVRIDIGTIVRSSEAEEVKRVAGVDLERAAVDVDTALWAYLDDRPAIDDRTATAGSDSQAAWVLATLTVYVRFGVVSSTVVSVCVFSNGRSGWLACDG
jgi:hypothetical protein